ncbi:hypothetical protein Tco_1522349 [Tanacetum coccineum]
MCSGYIRWRNEKKIGAGNWTSCVFKSEKPTSNIIKRVYALSLREKMELDLEARLMGEALILNRSLDSLYEDYIKLNELNEPLELRRNQVDDLEPIIEEGEIVDEPMMDKVKTSCKKHGFYRDEDMGDIRDGKSTRNRWGKSKPEPVGSGLGTGLYTAYLGFGLRSIGLPVQVSEQVGLAGDMGSTNDVLILLVKDLDSGLLVRTRALEQETRDLDVEIKQMKDLKASYGVTTPQDLRRNLIKEGMSQHHSYDITTLLPLRRNLPR